MYTFSQPTPSTIRDFIARQQEKPFSYAEVEYSRSELPSTFTIDHHRVCLGQGRQVFEQAQVAMRHWEMFNQDWVQLCWPDAPLEVGTTVAVLVRALGVYSLNACRIVYRLEEGGEIERFGFAYGTLSDHAECGEEQFSLEWHHSDDAVWYDILAFSRPNQLLSRVGYPYVRRLQKRFARGSMQAMVRAVGEAL
jgi:uncharacterized protein (UPF0548 family)